MKRARALGVAAVLALAGALVFLLHSVPDPPTQPEPMPARGADVAPPSRVEVVQATPSPDDARFEGRVEAEDRAPITAEIEFSNGIARVLVRSAVDGRFIFGAREGVWAVTALRAPGFVGSSPDLRLMARPGTVTEGLVLTMAAVRAVTVEVRSAGRALAGAEVSVCETLHGRRPSPCVEAVTGEDGAVTVQVLRSLRYTEVEAAHACCISSRLPLDASASAVSFALDQVTATAMERVSGLVVDEADAPVAGAQVELSTEARVDGGFVAQRVHTVSDSEGAFSAELWRGDFVNCVARLGDAESESEMLRPGDQLRLVLVSRTASFSGRVLDASGQPVKRFDVAVVGAHGYRESLTPFFTGDGRYRVTRQSAGEHRVEVLNRDFAPSGKKPIQLTGGEVTGVDFVLEAGLVTSGVVTDALTTLPIVGAYVSSPDVTSTTDETGRFELRTAGRTSRSLEVAAPHYVGRQTSFTPGQSLSFALQPSTDGGRPTEYEGIGLGLDTHAELDGGNGYPVQFVHDEGGARLAGIQVGDELLAVGLVHAGAMSFDEFNARVRGPSGTVVKVTIRRGVRVFDANVVRRKLVW